MIVKMSAKFIFCSLILTIMFALSVVNAACVCEEKGVDYCNKCKPATFLRPKAPRPAYINSELSLKPIGDTCSCNKIFVEPAPQPKPTGNKSFPKRKPCTKCQSKTSCSSCSPAPLPAPASAPTKLSACGCGSAPAFPSYHLPEVNHDVVSHDNTIPADPISISLAMQANKAVAVPEAKLAYGFAKKPIDSMRKITFSNIPEENLFKLKSEVITYKKPTLTASQPTEEEEEEEEETYEEEQYETGDEQQHQLTYSQLGYVPEKFKNPKFRKVITCGTRDYNSHEAYPIPDKVRVDCGYRPGRIAAYIKVKSKNEPTLHY